MSLSLPLVSRNCQSIELPLMRVAKWAVGHLQRQKMQEQPRHSTILDFDNQIPKNIRGTATGGQPHAENLCKLPFEIRDI
jgi:hypothetical protein